tara:strand:- start:221 stop:385 length:165 start_codon:yes stop_codon:yes gene_type:complete
MEYVLCIKSNPAHNIFRIKADSYEEAIKKFIAMKQMSEKEFNKLFIVAEVPKND